MLNKRDLAERLGVEPHTITRWELSQSEPSTENVDALARVLEYPREFFFGAEVEEPCCENTSFRSQTSMTAGERDAALAAGALGFLISDWVAEKFELPPSKLRDLRAYDSEGAAQALREEWRLGEKPIPNMIQLLESKGVRVFSIAENTTHVNAYSLWRKNTPYVFLNTIKSAECSRFDAAHELAHLVLHQDGSVTGRIAEDGANRFASAFLMPKADVFSVLPHVRHLQQLIKAKARWRVSLAALAYRVHKLEIISEWKYRDFCIEMGRRGHNKEEPAGMPREKSIVWEKVLKMLWSEKTTHKDIASDLGLPEPEVSDLLFGVLGSDRQPAQQTKLTIVTPEGQAFA